MTDYKFLLKDAIRWLDEYLEVETASCSLLDGSIPSTTDRLHYIEALANWLENARRAVADGA